MINLLAVSILTCIISLFSTCHDAKPTIVHMYTRGEIITETLTLEAIAQSFPDATHTTVKMSFTNVNGQDLQWTFTALTKDTDIYAATPLLHQPVAYNAAVVSSNDGLTLIDNVNLIDVEVTISK